MSQPSLWIDPDRLRAEATELHRLAAETEQIAEELKAAHARHGVFWGKDEAGKTFGEGYAPGAEQGAEGFSNLAANLRALSDHVRSAVDEFENRDVEEAISLGNLDSTDTGIPHTAPGGPALPLQAVNPHPVERYARQPVESARMSDDARHPYSKPTGDPAPAVSPRLPTAGQQPSSPAGFDHPGNSSEIDSGDAGASNAGSNDAVPRNAGSADTVPRHAGSRDSGPSEGQALPGATPAGRSSRGVATPTTVAASPNTGSPPARVSAGSPSTTSPWLGNPPRTPWAKAPGAVSPTEQGIPPRVSPPAQPRRPDSPVRPTDKKDRTGSAPRRPEPVAARPQRVTDEEAMRIARDMAMRHNLEITGFETAGISVQTAQAMADAVDTVLAKYPTILRGIEIEEEAGTLSRVENRAGTAVPGASDRTSPRSPQPWIVLEGVAVANPSLFAEAWVGARSTSGTLPEHPMYPTMLLEFGHVLDLVGGFRARREAQRALVTEYLRVSGAAGETLARVVEGYKRWRADLSDYCFDHRVLSPGRALAEGFADVEMRGGRASGPAKVLHRVLVSMALSDSG